jgi:predicted nuclease with TOPRIM domain
MSGDWEAKYKALKAQCEALQRRLAQVEAERNQLKAQYDQLREYYDQAFQRMRESSRAYAKAAAYLPALLDSPQPLTPSGIAEAIEAAAAVRSEDVAELFVFNRAVLGAQYAYGVSGAVITTANPYAVKAKAAVTEDGLPYLVVKAGDKVVHILARVVEVGEKGGAVSRYIVYELDLQPQEEKKAEEAAEEEEGGGEEPEEESE